MKSNKNPKDENYETEVQKWSDFFKRDYVRRRQATLKKHRSDKNGSPKDAQYKAYIKKLKKEEQKYQNKKIKNDLNSVDVNSTATGDLKENKTKYKP